MNLIEITERMSNFKNGTFSVAEYASDKSRQLNAAHKAWTVIKVATLAIQAGIDYCRTEGIEKEDDYESDYTYVVGNKVCYKEINGEKKYYVDLYPNSNKSQNKSEYIVLDENGRMVDVDLHEIMQPSFFKPHDSKLKRPFIRVGIESLISIH